MNQITEYQFKKTSSVQWTIPLNCFASELLQSLPIENIGEIFYGVGTRFYDELALDLAGLDTLQDLAATLNQVWSALDWGVCSFDEHPDQILITHSCAPLAAGFGVEQITSSAQVLSAFYQCVFDSLGAGQATRVQLAGVANNGMQLMFALRS